MGGIVEESLGVDRKAIRVITKIISVFRHQVYTSYGASLITYRGEYSDLVGTGQENSALAAIHRD